MTLQFHFLSHSFTVCPGLSRSPWWGRSSGGRPVPTAAQTVAPSSSSCGAPVCEERGERGQSESWTCDHFHPSISPSIHSSIHCCPLDGRATQRDKTTSHTSSTSASCSSCSRLWIVENLERGHMMKTPHRKACRHPRSHTPQPAFPLFGPLNPVTVLDAMASNDAKGSNKEVCALQRRR